MTQRNIIPENNRILYPIQKVMNLIIHLVVCCIRPITPQRYRVKLDSVEQSKTLNNVFGLTFFNAIGGFIVMLTNVKIANALGASEFGLYSYYLAVGEVGQNFVRYGLNKTMTRDLIQFPNKFNSLVSNALVLGLTNILVFLFVVIVFSKPLDIVLTPTSILLLLSPCIGSIDFQPVYESIKQMSWHSIYLFIQKVLFLSAVWCWIAVYKVPSLGFLGCVLFLSWALVVFGQFLEIFKTFDISFYHNVSFSSLKGLYKDNFIIALSCMAGVAFGPMIRLILKNYVDTQSVGIYSAGMQIFVLSQFLMHQISRVGNPIMAEAGKADCSLSTRRAFVRKYLALMFVGTIPFVIPLCLFPGLITDLFFSSEYTELARYLPIFGIYLLSLALGFVYTQFLISMRKDAVYFTIYVLSAISTIICAFILIPPYKVMGAVIALCVPHSVGCLFYYLCSIKYLK